MAHRKWFFFFILLLLTFAQVVMAQPGDPNDDADVPISGLGYLLMAGAILGIKKFRDFSRRKKQ